ncbi:hypothetical protein GM526_17510 [Enterococcus avium]|uniref:hypothetical protein n=1 Tax=Enterococcus avium TaxID=33945 RepID=UPI00159E1B41|nr:hypothetical protein [Enterococcus avium]NVN78859.1 hypothetical protein [Enterococcus avium]
MGFFDIFKNKNNKEIPDNEKNTKNENFSKTEFQVNRIDINLTRKAKMLVEEDETYKDIVKTIISNMRKVDSRSTTVTIHLKDGETKNISFYDYERQHLEDLIKGHENKKLYEEAMALYKDEKFNEAEQILFRLLNNEDGYFLDAYERLAIIYRKQKRFYDEYDLLEQELIDIRKRDLYTGVVVEKIEKRRDKAKMLMDKNM